MKPTELRPFDVLKNTANGELGLVVEIAGERVCLADRTGAKAFFRLGSLYQKLPREESGSFALAAIAGMRARRKEAAPRKKATTRVAKAVRSLR